MTLRKYFQTIYYKITVRFFPELAIFKNPEIDFGPVISDASRSEIDDKAKLYKPYHITDSRVGKYTYVSKNATISLTEIGAFCSIGPNLLCGWGIHPVSGISSHPMFYSAQKQNGISLVMKDKIEERKNIRIGNDVFIGANVTILDGITIGDGAIIGAGAVVSKDIPPYAVAVGCPVTIIKYRHSPEVIEKLLRIKWWNWDSEKLQNIEKYFDDVEGFVAKYS
jgi:virginiamycin A acetyltransferase